MQVTCLKLASGMDLIARVEKLDGTTFTLNKLMQIQAYPSPKGIAVSLIPFVLFCEAGDPSVETMVFERKDYLTAYKPKADLEAEYIQQTSGIQLAKGPITAVKG